MGNGRSRTNPKPDRRSGNRFIDAISRHKRGTVFLAMVILAIASIPRLFFSNWSYYPNGVDEGIDIMSGKMMAAGYALYTQVNTVQPPLMLSLYGFLDADPLFFRLLSTAASLVVLGLILYAAHRIGGKSVMVAAGAFMAMDLMFLHESRLASLDMFSLIWVAVGVALFIRVRERGEKWASILMGAVLGIAIMTKLFGVIASGAIFLILLYDLLSHTDLLRKYDLGRFLPPSGGDRKPKWNVLFIFSLTIALVVLFVMVFFGIEEVIQGIFINQLNRPQDSIFQKMIYFGVFFLCNIVALPFFFAGLKPTYRKREGIILLISAFYLVFMLIQAKTWAHHLIFLSPALSLTAGVGIIKLARDISSGKFKLKIKLSKKTVTYAEVLLIIAAAFVGGGTSLVIKERGAPVEHNAAEVLAGITEEGDYVISGDPMIPLLADRPIPPEVVNVAVVQWPPITSDFLNRSVIDYGVTAVVLSYHLLEMKGFVEFVEEHFELESYILETNLPFPMEDYEIWIYELPGDSSLRDHEGWGALIPEEESPGS
ncbi:MAG: ArnT family glycosyltransferase [Thermoplasmatota archaeon]